MKHDFSELEKLFKMLAEENIPCETFHERNITYERAQIVFPSKEKQLSDVVLIYGMIDNRPYSYGAPLLEQMGLLPEDYVDDDVMGGRTAEEVFECWKSFWEKNKEGF